MPTGRAHTSMPRQSGKVNDEAVAVGPGGPNHAPPPAQTAGPMPYVGFEFAWQDWPAEEHRHWEDNSPHAQHCGDEPQLTAHCGLNAPLATLTLQTQAPAQIGWAKYSETTAAKTKPGASTTRHLVQFSGSKQLFMELSRILLKPQFRKPHGRSLGDRQDSMSKNIGRADKARTLAMTNKQEYSR